MAHFYCRDGFVVFPRKKLTKMSSEGALFCNGCILKRFYSKRRGFSWVLFPRRRVRFHGVTLFNIESNDWIFSNSEILSVYTNSDKDIPFLHKGRVFPFSPLYYFFEQQAAIPYRWPVKSTFLIVETKELFFLIWFKALQKNPLATSKRQTFRHLLSLFGNRG